MAVLAGDRPATRPKTQATQFSRPKPVATYNARTLPMVAPVGRYGAVPAAAPVVAAPAPAAPVDSRTVTAYRATKPGTVQRRQLVDRLFDQGYIKGQRSYWYGDAGPEDLANLNLAADSMGDNPYRFLDLAEIRSALSAISAGYAQQRGQLQTEGANTRRAFALLDESLGTNRKQAITGAKSEASGRGILRSGLALQEVGRIGEDFAKQRAAALGERDARLRSIASTMAGMRGTERTQRAEAARKLAREQVGPMGDIARALQLV